MMKKAEAYMKKHPMFNATVHALGGVGVGIIVSPMVGIHPLRVAMVLIVASAVGHFYAWNSK